MRRSPLKRKTPLKPKKYIHRPKVEDTRNGGDFDRLVWIRKQPCCACNRQAPSHAHHFIGKLKGMAMKAPDSETMPLCLQCHKNLHEKLGMFRVMDRPALKSWQWAKILHFRLLYQRFLGKKLQDTLSASKLARESRVQLDCDEGYAIGLVTEPADS